MPTTEIEQKMQEILASGMGFGQPVGAEMSLYDGGAMQEYEFGRIYFHPRLGSAFECHGLIGDRYVALGAELGTLGYPTSDEVDNPAVPGGRMNKFEWGEIHWESARARSRRSTPRCRSSRPRWS